MATSPLTEKLHERALHYLERYAASAQSVRQVLQRGVQRDARKGQEISPDMPELIENEIARLAKAGLIDDASFAAMKTRSLRRAGASAQKVRQKLMMKGVKGDLIEEALQDEEAGDDKSAAITFARRRKLGPFARVANPEKHMATLARAGFSLALARWIVKAQSEVELLQDD